jgi:uroporphyrinogen-III decarboxylase
VEVGGVPGFGTDGPFTVACNVRGATELLMDLLEDPPYFDALLSYVTEATIERIRAYRKWNGDAERGQGFGFADDSIALLSPAVYEERVMPHHRRLIDELSSGGPNSIHLCGDATHLFGLLRRELDIQSFDTGFPVDFGALRSELGPDVEIYGGPSVPFLLDSSHEEVAAETRHVLSSGITEGGRFVLREGNNLAPGTALENVWAMYDTVREAGRYAASLG